MAISFPVSPEKQKLLRKNMLDNKIFEKDLKEKFFSGSTKGGQNANKSSTGVFLVHYPTGIEVKCSVYRTQGLNRYKARKIMCEKMSRGTPQGKDAEADKAGKIRKQKNRRKRRG